MDPLHCMVCGKELVMVLPSVAASNEPATIWRCPEHGIMLRVWPNTNAMGPWPTEVWQPYPNNAGGLR